MPELTLPLPSLAIAARLGSGNLSPIQATDSSRIDLDIDASCLDAHQGGGGEPLTNNDV